jgi:hypothetical protein
MVLFINTIRRPKIPILAARAGRVACGLKAASVRGKTIPQPPGKPLAPATACYLPVLRFVIALAPGSWPRSRQTSGRRRGFPLITPVLAVRFDQAGTLDQAPRVIALGTRLIVPLADPATSVKSQLQINVDSGFNMLLDSSISVVRARPTAGSMLLYAYNMHALLRSFRLTD